MIVSAPRLWTCRSGATAAEFALVVPLLLIFLLGIIDVGRYLWEVNEGEKATQVGARMAVVTNPVSTGLVDADFASGTLPAGELIPADALGELVCTSTSCTCTGCPTAIGGGVDSAAFNAIVARMAQIKPGITAANVEITYRGSGFGFAEAVSGPGGGGVTEKMEISPLVTVSLKDVAFTPLAMLFAVTVPLPAFATTMTAEDSSGAVSN
jgi:Flp pilus assembly protein TadG